MEHELRDEVHEQVQQLCAEGDELAQEGRCVDAIAKYESAWDLLPEPKEEWEAATWILGAVADAQFFEGEFEAARSTLSEAMRCPGAIGNPFLHMRLGQCELERGNSSRAADELARAYMGAGEEIFASEDPKYLAFIKARLEPPAVAEGADLGEAKPWWKLW